MFGIFKKKQELSDLSPAMIEVAQKTTACCLAQISKFVGGSVPVCPDFGPRHDAFVAAYAAGFLTGMLQVTRADAIWSSGDKARQEMGYVALIAASQPAILGPDRALAAFELLPFHGRAHPLMRDMDGYGGSDGMAEAEGREKQMGGLLLHYLKHNVHRGN